MSIHAEWLNQRGADYIAQIGQNQCSFLSEISLNSTGVLELFSHLRGVHVPKTDQQWACMAVAAVNAAVLATEEHTSFIEMFLPYMACENRAIWQEHYGPGIERFFTNYLNHNPRSGAWRYVGAIYAHAGVAARVLPSFGHLVSLLRDNWGFSISKLEYEEALNSVVISTFGREFLKSEDGYPFTKDCLRTLERIESRIITPSEIDNLPGYRPGFWTELLRHLLRTETRPSGDKSGFRMPWIALDLDRLRILICFEGKGVMDRAYKLGSQFVISQQQEIVGPRALTGTTDQPDKRRDTWSLEPWVPGKEEFAFFRFGDGAYLDVQNSISPGDYYLATSQEISDSLVTERLGVLDYPFGDSMGFFSVIRVHLSAGQSLDPLPISVSGIAPTPALEFTRTSDVGLTLPRHTFVGKLPDLLVANWNSVTSRLYTILADIGTGTERVDQLVQNARLRLGVSPPLIGRIWVEPKGRTALQAEGLLSSVSFTLIPEPIQLEYPTTIVSPDDPVQIHLTSPHNGKLQPVGELISVDDKTCVVSPGVRIAEGLVVAWGLTFPFSVRLNRFGLSLLDSTSERLLWLEELDLRRIIQVNAAPRQSCTLILAIGTRSIPLWTISALDQIGRGFISSLEIRDTILRRNLRFGEFVIEIDQQRRIGTGVFLLSAEMIASEYREHVVEPFCIVRDLEETLRVLDRTYDQPQTVIDVNADLLRTPLRSFLCEFLLTAKSFDNSEINLPLIEVNAGVTPELKTLLSWVKKAKDCDYDLTEASRLTATFPGAGPTLLLPRWRKALADLRTTIAEDSSAAGLLAEWKGEIDSGIQVKYTSRIARLPGGDGLTSGAGFYLRAVNSRDPRLFTRSIGELQRVLIVPNYNQLVLLLASALLQLAYLRSGRVTSAAEIVIPVRPPGFERLRTAMRAIVAECKSEMLNELWPADIGLSAVSPFEGDTELEIALESGRRHTSNVL